MCPPYIYLHRLVILCLLHILPGKSYCQNTSQPDGIGQELLAIYKQAITTRTILDSFPCDGTVHLNIEEQLIRALWYNRRGNWQCCNSMLQAIFVKQVQLKPLEACHFYLAWAEYYTLHQSYDSANHYATLASITAGEGKWENEQAQALLWLSTGDLKRRNISSAYSRADSALVLARESGNQKLEGNILLQLGLCARRHFTSIAKRSFPYYLQAREKALATADSLTLSTIDLFLGIDNFEVKRWDEGLPYLKEGIALSLRNNDLSQLYTVYISLGYPLMIRNYLPEALAVLKKALSVSQQQLQPYNMQVSYHFISGIYQNLNQYDSALIYAELSGKVPGVDSFWSNVWDMKASIYEDIGDYKMAVEMHKKSVDWYREDFLYRNQDQLSGYEAKLNTKEKELQVTQQKKRALRLEWMIGGIGGLLIMAAGAFLLQRKAKQKLFLQNNLIEKQQKALERSLGEKELLLKEIHHRVKNNLSVISSLLELQSSGLADDSAKAAIAVGQNRVSSIALIHQRLYQHENLAAIELNGFLQDLLRQVSSIFKKPDTQIQMQIDVPETLLDIDTAVPLGLIMNELLTNSYKYAFDTQKEGLIKIDLEPLNPGDFILNYADNGPGIANNINIKNSTSLGLRLINRLSKQLGGSATYQYNNGSSFKIHFKDSIRRNQGE